MANYPPPYPPPAGPPPYNVDPRYQRQAFRDQARMQRDAIRAQRDRYRAQMRGLRRNSIVGPLVVIAVGVLFLLVQVGRLPAQFLWHWYGRWWPLLLIGIGVIRLAEWGLDQIARRDLAPSVPQPRRVMGGGVITLLVLLAGTGIFFSAVRNHGEEFFGHGFSINQDNLDEFLGDKHESDQTVTHPCPEGSTVSIDNPRGDVSISGTSDDGQIHIAAHKQVYTRTDSDADNKAQQLSPRVDASGNSLKVTVPWIEGTRADLTVTLPGTTTLAINANRGDVRVSSIKAAISVTANHGDVDLSAIHGAVSGHINNGDSSFSARSVTGAMTIEGRGKDLNLSDLSGPIAMSGEFFGTTHLEHIRGPIHFHTSRTDLQLTRLEGEVEISPNADLSADQIAGPVTLNTRNRNITLDRVTGDLAVTNRNGSVDLTVAPPIGNVTVENRNGSVNVTVPNEAGFVVQAETTNGDVQNEFSLPNGGGENHPGLSGTVNHGGPLIRITTSQGDISLKKGSIAPLPPLPPAPPKLTALPAGAPEGLAEATAQVKEARRQATEQLKSAREQVRSANRSAAEAQHQAQRSVAEAQREVDRATRQAKQAEKDQGPQ